MEFLVVVKQVARSRSIVAKWKPSYKLWIITSTVAPHLTGMNSKEMYYVCAPAEENSDEFELKTISVLVTLGEEVS